MTLSFRPATDRDLATLVDLLADDDLGTTRESPGSAAYADAFRAIEVDPNNELVVAELDGAIAGFLQLTFLPSLTYEGRWRALIESVRVRADLRDRGVGAALVEHAVARARAHPCHLVQLTTDKRRPAALRFYERLGFAATHEGLKRHLDDGAPVQ